MKDQLTVKSLLIQWYEETQKKRIDEGFIDSKSINDIYSDLSTGYDNCTRIISLKQYKLFQALYSKQFKNFPRKNELCFVNLVEFGLPFNKSIVANISSEYNRGHIYFKLIENQ